MSLMHRINLKHTLLMFTMLMITAIITTGYTHYQSLQHLQKDTLPQTQKSIIKLFHYLKLKEHFINIQLSISYSAVRSFEADLETTFLQTDKKFQQTQVLLTDLIALHTKNKELLQVEKLKQFKENFKRYYKLGKVMVSVYIRDGKGVGNILIKPFDEQSDYLLKQINTWVNLFKKSSEFSADDKAKSVHKHFSKLEDSFLYSLLIVLVLLLLFAMTLSLLLKKQTNTTGAKSSKKVIL